MTNGHEEILAAEVDAFASQREKAAIKERDAAWIGTLTDGQPNAMGFGPDEAEPYLQHWNRATKAERLRCAKLVCGVCGVPWPLERGFHVVPESERDDTGRHLYPCKAVELGILSAEDIKQ